MENPEMITFKKFLSESALQRKFKKQTGATKLDVEGADVVHHDPENHLTVYHAKTHDGLKRLVNGMGNCLAKAHDDFRQGYMSRGNVFLIHSKRDRITHFVPHRGDAVPETSIVSSKGNIGQDTFDGATYGTTVTKRIGKHVMDKLDKIPHHYIPRTPYTD
jgi:hypothetical protein